MRLISIYIWDARYSVPTWQVVELETHQANAFGLDVLYSDAHYARVELWLDETCLAAVARPAVYRAAA
jgi:hypothetical protein